MQKKVLSVTECPELLINMEFMSGTSDDTQQDPPSQRVERNSLGEREQAMLMELVSCRYCRIVKHIVILTHHIETVCAVPYPPNFGNFYD